MADFSSTEKINASWKHLFGVLGTSNNSGAAGKMWYEELLSATHIITQPDIWTDTVPYNTTYSGAAAANPAIVENRSDSASVTLVANGSNWDIVCSFAPKAGYQLTNTHPNPSYVKSITNVISTGGSNYTITLNNNTGVSAGSAVVQRRVYLTVDPTTNNLAWFARSTPGDSFSPVIENFIQPQRFGKGYTVRLFQANGTEILTTQGAWIFNWQKGILLFASGQTPVNLGYSTPLYIEGFRYVGTFGLGDHTLVVSGELHDTLRFDGTNYVPNSTLKADGTNVYIRNGVQVSGYVTLPSGSAPSGSVVSGLHGEFRWDNNFLYIKTDLGWARTSLQYF